MIVYECDGCRKRVKTKGSLLSIPTTDCTSLELCGDCLVAVEKHFEYVLTEAKEA